MPHCASPAPHAFGPVLVCFLTVLLVLSALARFASCSASSTTGWLASDYPDPRVNPPGDCGFTSGEVARVTPNPTNSTNWVCDPDRVLSLEEALSLADFLNSLSHRSPCDCQTVECPGSDVTPMGFLIGVALVGRLNIEGMKFEPLNVKAANFAKVTREKWFSDLGCQDNALIFYSRFSNELYISIGEAMEGVVSDLELASLYSLGEQYLTGEDSASSSSQQGEGEAGQTTPSSSAVTYDGLMVVASNLHEAILNGPSITSDVIFAFSIPLLLLVVLTAMCLVSNICCAQDISLPEPVGRTSKTEEDAKSEDAKSENEEEEEPGR